MAEGSIRRGVMESVPLIQRHLQDVRCCDGDSVTFEAKVDAPENSIVRWEKQGKVLKLGGDMDSEFENGRVRLKIREVYPEDEGEYSCIIHNDMGKAVTSATLVVENIADDKENDVTVQMERRPDLSRRSTPSRTNTPSRFSRSPSVGFQRHRYTPEPSPKSRSRRSHGPKFYYIPHDRIVEEGETVTFQCAVKGYPTPKSTWDKDSVKLYEGGRIRIESKDDVRILEIAKVTQQDAGLYRVTIENELGREQATARLDVIKASGNRYAGYVRSWHTTPYTAPRFSRGMPPSTVREGSRLTLSTDYRGSPTPRAKWYRNNQLLPRCDDYRQTSDGKTATLEVAAVTVNEAGTYKCVLENEVGRAECSCQVVVECPKDQGRGPPHFLRGLEDTTVLDGDQLRLSVQLEGSSPLKVVWVRNDREIKPCPDFQYETGADGEYSLVVSDIFPEDAGVYICEAYNILGNAHSFARVRVHDPTATQPCAPRILESLTPLEVEEGAPANFRVRLRGLPRPSLSWFCDDRHLKPTPRIKLEEYPEQNGRPDEVVHTLSILHALATDSGVISVVASSKEGSDSAFTNFKVHPYTPEQNNNNYNNSTAVATSAVTAPLRSRFLNATATSPTDNMNSTLTAMRNNLRSVSSSRDRASSIPVSSTPSRMTPSKSSPSMTQRNRPSLKDLKQTPMRTSVDSAYGSMGHRDSTSGRSTSSLSTVSDVECDSNKVDNKSVDKVEEEEINHQTIQEEEEVNHLTMQEEEVNHLTIQQDVQDEEEEKEEEMGAELLAGPLDVTALKGQSAVLKATLCGHPPPEVKWYKKEQELATGGRYTITTDRSTTSLRIDRVVQDDCDKYTVVVRNKYSSHTAYASLAVESAPEPPAHKPNLSEVTSEAVTLSWYGPTYDGGSVVTGYIVESRKAHSYEQWNTLITGCHSTSYIIRNLEPDIKYEFRVRAQNVHGVSEPSRPSEPACLAPPSEACNGKDDGHKEDGEEEEYKSPFDFKHVEIENVSELGSRFQTHEEVGKGRFGIVYRATDVNSGHRMAAKVIKCITSKEKDKVREEISIMNSLRHPKLLQLAAAYELPRQIVMIMEYISGGELFERVVADDFALTERDCILFVRQICEGVQYMHQNNIVHLDLKPENILCVRRTSHQIKLIDFGLARRFNPEDPCRVLFGTPEFIAPEIINYEPISFSSDMWSVGVICYVLLSGLSPFMGDNDAETFANITRAEFDFDDDAFDAITDDAKDFITSLLTKRKEERPTAAECLKTKWLDQHEGTMNKVVLSTDKLKKFIIRRKWQKTGNAIRALGRMASLTSRRNSQPNSPTRLSTLHENSTPSSTPGSSPLSSPSPIRLVPAPQKIKGVGLKTSNSVISERSDSGISECSFREEENGSNPPAAATTTTATTTTAATTTRSGSYSHTNGRSSSISIPTESSLHPRGKTSSLNWQSSVDSAFSEEDVLVKNSYNSSRKLSRETLLQAKNAETLLKAHSRV